MAQIDAPAMIGQIKMYTGSLALAELSAMLDALPVDITFVDANDKVRYFSQSLPQPRGFLDPGRESIRLYPLFRGT
jgi:hypothetical protein